MSPFSRRDFLKTTAMSFALMAGSGLILDPLRRAWAENPAALNELLVLCDTAGEMKRNPTGITVTGPGSIKILDVASGKSFSIDVPFFGHTVTQNPRTPHQLVTFEKWGRRGALVDVKNKTVIATAEPSEGNIFFGHAVFVSGGSVLVNSEDSYARDNGDLVLRDPANLKIIQRHSAYGVRPHECRIADNDKTVMVVNQGHPGRPSNIAWIDMVSGKLLHNVALGRDADHAAFAHLDVSFDGWICAGGAVGKNDIPVDARIAFVSPQGSVKRPKIPAALAGKMTGESLSVAFLGKSGLVAVTLPKSSTVAVFDYKTQEFAGSASIRTANGVVPDLTAAETSMIVSSGEDMDLIKVKASRGGNVMDAAVNDAPFGGKGSHLTRIYA